ncbi:cobalamin synthase [Rhizobium sp. Root274]|uniref:adenosylcobinamide-GDP ribazoletransferase n=1 Tax=unclassified Rhizobium TaxID=2613769 RepID=UPI000713CB83|nr:MULTISPECIES: adenosylcobinamide-GDP ribazoletransferase [unclassified Rhizobium]KQW28757.1 cobalamin synthase [Rhizobium sp. Root1240]KRD28953.1 cobalamin synthase [Rhizobium sp. Root274]
MLSGRDLVNETARAISFLSRFPVPNRYFANHDGTLSQTVAAFPLAGLLITLPAATLLGLLALADAPPLVAVLLSLTVQVMVTGALHEDGLTDTADGLGGGRDRERALAIMKDSRIGTYGALALILSVGLRAAALAALTPAWPPLATALIWLAAAAISRAAMVWHWSSLPPAKADGVAASVGHPDPAATRFAIACGLAASILLGLFVLPFAPVVATLSLTCLMTAGFTAFVKSKIRGHTGDTIGASQQIAEIGYLLSLAIFL